ncbi:MAG TPA: hypothetical protein VK464_01360 [Symbiobacteriaceae bacterium]|nr:hypothetical protein [Symbiobacteriaceae bacterium]
MRTVADRDGDIWIYGDEAALNALAAGFDGVAEGLGAVYLPRQGSEGKDLLIFRGAVMPLRLRDYERLRNWVRNAPKGEQVTWEAKPEVPEDWKDGEWKWDDQATFQVKGRCAFISGSPLGLRYCALGALRIEGWQGGHTHIFWCATSKSVELTIAYADYPGP